MNITVTMIALIAALAAGCAERDEPIADHAADDHRQTIRDAKEPQMEDTTTGTEPAAKPLPFAQGRTFATLDAYLAHLKSNGAIGLPWFREIRPGVYVRATTFVPTEDATNAHQLYTREDLLKRFGFKE